MATLVLGLAAAVLLVAAELSPVLEITVNSLPCEVADPELAEQCAPTGADRHSWALVVLALLVLAMAWGAGAGASRPAAAAMAIAGAVTLAIVLTRDLPVVDDTGQIGLLFEAAAASPGSGFWLSLAGGVLALAAGLIGLLPRR